jgi:hypothetical protein
MAAELANGPSVMVDQSAELTEFRCVSLNEMGP